MCTVPSRMNFYSSLMLLAPGIFSKFWSIPSLIRPNAPKITGKVPVLIPHILMVSISRSLCFESFSMTFVEVFLSDGTDTSISLQHRLAWSLITISGLFIIIIIIIIDLLSTFCHSENVSNLSSSCYVIHYQFSKFPDMQTWHPNWKPQRGQL